MQLHSSSLTFKFPSYAGWQSALAFSGGSIAILGCRILLLLVIRGHYQELPSLIVAGTVVLPAFCFFTALGFHRDFYKSYIPREIRGIKDLYSQYVSIATLWLTISLSVFLIVGFIFGEDLISLFILATLIVVDRIQDERMRIYFFTKQLKPWLLVNSVRTIAPIIICIIIWDLSVVQQTLVVMAYFLAGVFIHIPRVYYQQVMIPRLTDIKRSFGKQGIYSFASQLRRNLDRLLAIPVLGSDLAFSYNLLIQLANGSVLVFEKFINVLERQSYLRKNQGRIKINRLPFFLVGTLLVMLVTLADTRLTSISNTHIVLFLLCLLCWSISLCDREFEFNWWKGNIVAYYGSVISIGLSASIAIIILVVIGDGAISLVTYVSAFLSVPLLSLAWIKRNRVENE